MRILYASLLHLAKIIRQFLEKTPVHVHVIQVKFVCYEWSI
jgi:hypothetical protein